MLYFPVFRGVEATKEYFKRMNRAAYMIIEGGIKGVMETNRSIELMKNAAILIEPLSEHPIEIMPDDELPGAPRGR